MMRKRIFLALFALALVAALLTAAMRNGSGRATPTRSSAASTDREVRADCTRQSGVRRHACHREAFASQARAGGAGAAIAGVEEHLRREPDFINSCHMTMHDIGLATIAREDGNLDKAMEQGSSLCGAGYYHGVLERALMEAGDLQRAVASLCTTRLEASQDCAHGLGHGLFAATGYDLQRSLALCDGMIREEIGSCVGGIFMENVESLFGNDSSPWIRADDLEYPCLLVRESQAPACYSQVVERMRLEGRTPAAMLRGCASLSRRRTACAHTVGIHVAIGRNVLRPVEQTHRICRTVFPEGGDDCIASAAAAYASFTAAVSHSASLCRLQAPAARGRCARETGVVLRHRMPPAAVRRACSELGPRWSDCLAGAGMGRTPT
jgi:hypothetical protein